MRTTNPYNLGLLILRIVFSAMLLVHGIEKIEILFSSEIKFADPIGLGPTISLILVLIAEIICPILIIIGYKVKLATVPPIILMLVAIFIVHKGDSILALESAILYLAAFTSIGLLGGGDYSINKLSINS